MKFDILTLFPESIAPYLQASILGRGQKDGLLTFQTWNIRDFATDKHHTVDDTPYGGGAGMIMKIEPIDAALRAIKERDQQPTKKTRTIVLSPRGKQFNQQMAKEYAELDQLILICGRYEGIDQRVIDHLADEEISAGPYVVAGGELPALIILEATARLIPGVLGNPESLIEESFSITGPLAEYPQYTKPESYNGWEVPAVLRSGDHQAIREWRKNTQANSGTSESA